MEKWIEVFKNIIPNNKYSMRLSFGEENGLLIILNSKNKFNVKIDFGVIKAFRVWDEGVVINGVFSEFEISKFKQNTFSNVIYKIENGTFKKEILETLGEYSDFINLDHYIIITINYIVEVITEWTPEIKVEVT